MNITNKLSLDFSYNEIKTVKMKQYDQNGRYLL